MTLEITHESKYEVWHMINDFKIWVFVIEFNQGEIIRRKVLDVALSDYDEPGRPWPFRRTEKLILRRWDCGGSLLRGYGVAALFRYAEELRRALESGKEISPSYTLEGRLTDGTKRRTERKEKNDQRA